MSNLRRTTVGLTDNELKEVRNAIGAYKIVLKSRAAKKQHKYGYRDDSLSRKRYNALQTAQRKFSHANRIINGTDVIREETE